MHYTKSQYSTGTSQISTPPSSQKKKLEKKKKNIGIRSLVWRLVEDSKYKSTPTLVSPRRGTAARRIFPFCLAEIDGDRLHHSRVQFRESILAEKRARIFQLPWTHSRRFDCGQEGSDINIVLPKRNTLSREKFSPEDQESKLFKSFPRCSQLRGL